MRLALRFCLRAKALKSLHQVNLCHRQFPRASGGLYDLFNLKKRRSGTVVGLLHLRQYFDQHICLQDLLYCLLQLYRLSEFVQIQCQQQNYLVY